MLIAIGDNKDILKELYKNGEDSSLLARFVHLARFFNPKD
jgi:hypothetical protein